MLKAPRTKRLKLSNDEPPPNFAFEFNLRRYTWGAYFHSAENLAAALPDADPPLAHVADFVRQHCQHRGTCDFAGHMLDPRLPAPSCAIVGNGGRLRYETRGAAIDAADVVLRFNNGRTRGFEKQVGKKSSFRFYNGPSVEPKQVGELTVAQLRVGPQDSFGISYNSNSEFPSILPTIPRKIPIHAQIHAQRCRYKRLKRLKSGIFPNS